MPHLELSAEVDVTGSVSDALTARLIRATALALREVSRANASYRDGRFEHHERVNVGLVIATDEALQIPVIFDADRKSVQELEDEAARLSERAQTGTLTPPELAGATFTLTDAGAYGATAIAPVIVPPHAAALGAGAVRSVALIREGQLVPGQLMTITLVADHRILYGQEAYSFLAAVRRELES